MKAFGAFIRLPKPRAPLPIRLVDTASHVNEMQSGREKGRETPTSLCQFFAGARSLFLRRWLSLLLSVCRPRDVTPFHRPPLPHPKPTAIVAPPPPILPLSLGKIMICLFFLFFCFPSSVRAELCTSLMFHSEALIHTGFIYLSIYLFPGKLQW